MQATAWDKFETALKNDGQSFESVKGLTNDEDITALIKEYGITMMKEIAVVLTEFKKRRGTFHTISLLFHFMACSLCLCAFI